MYHQTIRKEINEKKNQIKEIKQQKRYYLKQKRNANLILRSINSKETGLLKKISKKLKVTIQNLFTENRIKTFYIDSNASATH